MTYMVFPWVVACMMGSGGDLVCSAAAMPDPVTSVERCEAENTALELRLLEQEIVVIQSGCIEVGNQT